MDTATVRSRCYQCGGETTATVEKLPNACPTCGSREMSSAKNMFMVHDLVEKNGRSIRENNEAIQHKIPLGALVEAKYDEWFGDGACQKVHARLWVVQHSRDCDGSPLYTLSRYKSVDLSTQMARMMAQIKTGLTEDQLKPIEVTPDLVYGHGVLAWDDES
jgi:DNA-directed RNA polymerase subunit RPC12/RpoP